MTLSDQQWEFMKDVAKLIAFADSIGYKLTGGELFRTPEQQAIYVETGMSKTQNSQHLKRLAIDLNIFKDGNLTYDKLDVQILGDFWERLHPQNQWGGNWTKLVDTPHFERKG